MKDMKNMMITDEALENVNGGYIYRVSRNEYGMELWEVINDKTGECEADYYCVNRASAEFWAEQAGQSSRELTDKELSLLCTSPELFNLYAKATF